MFVSWLIVLNGGTAAELLLDDGEWVDRAEAFDRIASMLRQDINADVELRGETARGRQEVIFSNRGQLALLN